MSSAVVGTNTTGVGVSGTGSTYGVYGVSTAPFAGVAGLTSTAAPGVFGQTTSIGPGILGIGGLGDLVDSILDGSVDAAATQIAGQYPGCAGIFIGDVQVTGTLTAKNVVSTNSVTAASGAFSGSVTANSATVTGTLTGASATFSGSLTADDANVRGTLTGASATFSGDIAAKDVILSGADCAEEFDVLPGAPIEPGSVVVFGDDGKLSTSPRAYNKRVAGVISGAGAYRPGVILDRRASSEGRAPVALAGKVYCRVDAAYAAIEVGDLLTTSPTAGFAMKASDAAQAFGAVIGKALASHKDGCGLIPILVSLQ